MSKMWNLPPFDYFQHRRDCREKQLKRAQFPSELLSKIDPDFNSTVTIADRGIYSRPLETLVKEVQAGKTKPIDILRAYTKAAIRAHDKTNCITEILYDQAFEKTHKEAVNLKGPLAGIPVSLKDTVPVAGYDAGAGYSAQTNLAIGTEDAPTVRILKAAGAIPFLKTNVPITLLSFESANDVWGRTTNPHNKAYSPGGSSGGEAALLASGGSRIGIGTDVAGSVRLPAHWSGCYALRCSTGRWPKASLIASMPGQEGVPSVASPMARTLDDLAYFTREFIRMKPWEYDHGVHPLAWRSDMEMEWLEKKTLKIGVMSDDGVVPPTPACARALKLCRKTLQKQGHTIVDVSPPSPLLGLQLASQLVNSDGCATFMSHFRTGETNDPGAAQLAFFASLPSFIRYLYYLWVRYVRRDPVWASLLRHFGPKSSEENWKLVAQRDEYRAEWHKWWNAEGVDALLTVPNATPALPHGAMKDAVSACGYTFLFNLLDYTAGVLPVTKVNRVLDQLKPDFDKKNLNGVARGAYKHYDASKMEGLPVGVQVVGRRLEEEKVLALMARVESALGQAGPRYDLLEVD